MENRPKNIYFYISLILIVLISQFILGYRHLQYGFNIDDWNILAWYKQVVSNPILDFVKAWKAIGPHNFSHAYYIGVLFEFFKFDYPSYHILNTLFKALSALSLFPLIYLLFKNKWLAFLTTIIFAVHFTPFGGLNNVLIGEDSLMITSMNLFFSIYIWAFQNHKFNFKTMLILITFLLAASYFDITRFYPILMLLPFVEVMAFWLNKSQRNIKMSILRLFILYLPFIALITYSSRTAIGEFNLNKLTDMLKTGNYQLLVSLFASYGSTFMPISFIDQISLLTRVGNGPIFRNLWTFLEFLFLRSTFIFIPILVVIGSLSLQKSGKFIWRSLLLFFLLCSVAFWMAYHWQHLDSKIRISDPGTYFIPAVIGIFVFSTAISFFIEWIHSKDRMLLALFIAPIAAFLYTFLTWLLVDGNSIFMGVHGYISVAAIGSSLYLAILLYLAFQKFSSSKSKLTKRITATITVIYFILFIIFSAQMIDNFYAYWLKNGFSGIEQDKIHESFWREVNNDRVANGQNSTLIYFDGSQDYDNGYFYSQSFVWDIPAMVSLKKGELFDMNIYCRTVVATKDFDKMRIVTINGEKMVVQNTCGYDLAYKIDNFYAFRMMNRDLIPIKSEILAKLESK